MPEAAHCLPRVEDQVDLGNADDWMAARGGRVFDLSLGWFGRLEDSGTIASTVLWHVPETCPRRGSQVGSSVNIYVVHHKPGWKCANEVFVPIQGGKAVSSVELDMIGDDTGDNISLKNPTHSELTALYWIWKNAPRVDFVGLCHYRRYFAWDEQRYRSEQSIASSAEAATLCDPAHAKSVMEEHDVVLSEPLRIGSSIAQQYAACHIASDLATAIDTVVELYPDYAPHIAPVLFQTNDAHICDMFICNMFIMRRDLFEQFADWLFAILQRVEDRIEVSSDPYQARAPAFLSERLMNLFVHKEIMGRYRVKVLPWVVVELG